MNLLSLLDSRGLLPDNLTSHEGSEHSSSTFTQLRSLLFDALFGNDEDGRNRAWDDLSSLVDEGRRSQHADAWLGLEEFMARLNEWTLGKDSEDIRLVFNAGAMKLAEWFDSFMADNEPAGRAKPDLLTGLSNHSEKIGQGMALVFTLDEMKVVDMLLSDQMTELWTGAGEPDTSSQPPASKLYEPGEVSLVDLLAS